MSSKCVFFSSHMTYCCAATEGCNGDKLWVLMERFIWANRPRFHSYLLSFRVKLCSDWLINRRSSPGLFIIFITVSVCVCACACAHESVSVHESVSGYVTHSLCLWKTGKGKLHFSHTVRSCNFVRTEENIYFLRTRLSIRRTRIQQKTELMCHILSLISKLPCH